MKIYILAAGKGSRMGTYTDEWPKVMTRIGHETLISRLVRQWHHWSKIKIHIIGRYHSNVLQTHLDSLKQPTELVLEPFPHREAGSSVHFARQHAQDDCWIISGDSYMPDDFFDNLDVPSKHHKLYTHGQDMPTMLVGIKNRRLISETGASDYAGVSYWQKDCYQTNELSGTYTLADYIKSLHATQSFLLEGTHQIHNINTRLELI